MYEVIRVSSDYRVVVVATGGPDDPDTKCYVLDSYRGMTEFEEMSPVGVMTTYFAGIADGMGFGEIPKESFKTLDAIRAWSKRKSLEETRDALKRIADGDSYSADLRQQAKEELAELEQNLKDLDRHSPG